MNAVATAAQAVVFTPQVTVGGIEYAPVHPTPAARSSALLIPVPEGEPLKIPKGSTNPLMVVEYTSKAGKTARYGVFWSGISNGDEGPEHKLGLRRMTKDGRRLTLPNAYNKGFFVLASKCKRVA